MLHPFGPNSSHGPSNGFANIVALNHDFFVKTFNMLS